MKQPKRTAAEGQIRLTRHPRADGDVLLLVCTHDGEELYVRLGIFNAFRAVGMLFVMLELPLPACLRKVRLTAPESPDKAAAKEAKLDRAALAAWNRAKDAEEL